MPQDTSPRQLAANQANAQKSTGPRTPDGKARSAQNAATHRLSATTFVLDFEDLAAYETLRDAYFHRFAPRDPVETHLVEQIARAAWTLQRAWTIENESLNHPRAAVALFHRARTSK